MASITAKTTVRMTQKKKAPSKMSKMSSTKSKSSAAPRNKGTKRGTAPKLQPKLYAKDERLQQLLEYTEEKQRDQITDLLRNAFGEPSFHRETPHTASDTRSRSFAAADIAAAAQALGLPKVLKTFGVLGELERMLIPNGIAAVFASNDAKSNGGMRRIVSTNSLISLQNSESSFGMSNLSVSDGRMKSTPANAREGALLILRALMERVGPGAEPFCVPLLAAALDECGSSSSSLRETAEDTSRTLCTLSNPHATTTLLCPVLFAALDSPEWRVKFNALSRLTEMAEGSHKLQISGILPSLIPLVTQEVWDTKPQVTKAAGACLMATCMTNINPDVAPAVPAVVHAICKPSDTHKAVEELMSTTFVSDVDASTLAILCPVLSRGLREKQALHKRSACIVIQNMSRLVNSPAAVEPFGPLLVPDLKKVVENVQFDEMRDVALAALQTLTKALGHASVEEAMASVMAEEQRIVEEEQQRIEEEREIEAAREEASRIKEEEERKQWKEAMEAQRLLEKIAEQEASDLKKKERLAREKSHASTKNDKGKCQGCGLKKCRKDCLFRN